MLQHYQQFKVIKVFNPKLYHFTGLLLCYQSYLIIKGESIAMPCTEHYSRLVTIRSNQIKLKALLVSRIKPETPFSAAALATT